MKFRKQLSLLACFLVAIGSSLFAQNERLEKVALQNDMRHHTMAKPVIADQFFDQYAKQMGLNNAQEMKASKEIDGKNDFKHLRYRQEYKSIPVFGAAYTLHTKNGVVKSTSGYYLPSIDLDVNASISKEEAIAIAMQEMKAEKYSWESHQHGGHHADEHLPQPELCIIDRSFPNNSGQYALAYKVELQSVEPFDKQQYFIDAHSGYPVVNLPLLMHQGVPTKGVCKYYGEQTIIIDSLAPDLFNLRDPTRGNGNGVYTNNGELWSSNTNNWDLTNADQDEVAVDAHYCTQRFYDMMKDQFAWDGIDGEGGSMNIIVHAGNFVNAFWDGEFASFGDGDCNNGPLTTMEVIAHEFAHGITQYTSGLIYRGESGAINESMSDVFGKALEWEADRANFSWTIGKSFIETPYVEPFRSMIDPSSKNHPDFYKGGNWRDGAGVHTNSSVGNHWFYLLVNGEAGTNEAGQAYNIQGIGMEKALQIVFLTEKAYLMPSSNYQFYFESSMQAAEEIYGANASEIEAVRQAWLAVGVPWLAPDGIDLTVTLEPTFQMTCIKEDYASVEVIVSNVGQSDFDPSTMSAYLLLNDNEQLLIEEAIAPGESIVLTYDQAVFFNEEDDFFAVNIEVFSDDDLNDQNNQDNTYFFNAYHDVNDLELRVRNDDIRNCTKGTYALGFSIINRSCDTMRANTPVQIKISDNNSNFEWVGDYTIPFDLRRDASTLFREEVPIDLIDQGLFTIELLYDDDPKMDNNEVFLELAEKEIIQDVYADPFNDLNEKIFRTDPNDFFNYDIKEFDTNFHFAASGRSSFPSGTMCPTAEGNLNRSVSGQVLTCLDLKGISKPKLDFDLTQFRDDRRVNFPELYDQTSAFRVQWISESGSVGEEIVVAQSEGESQHYQFDLPQQFKGSIQLDFFNNTGALSTNEFLTYDVTLMDNFEISGLATNTEELEKDQILIFPNPSAGIFAIQHPQKPEQLIIRNSQGKELMRFNSPDQYEKIDLSKLPDGFYFLTALYATKTLTKNLIKVSN